MDLSKVCSCLNNEAQIDGTIKNEAQIGSELAEEKQINSDMSGLVVTTSGTYEGLETEDITVDVDNKNRTISAKIRQIQYKSKLEFPNVGSESLIYIDISENATYRWDIETLSYVCVGRDYAEIGIIMGGGA